MHGPSHFRGQGGSDFGDASDFLGHAGIHSYRASILVVIADMHSAYSHCMLLPTAVRGGVR